MEHIYGEGLEVGVRVELHPRLDLWMKGARFGTITAIENLHGANQPYARVEFGPTFVAAKGRKLKPRWFPISDLRRVDPPKNSSKTP